MLVENSLAALEVHERIFPVDFAVEVQRSAVLVLFRYEAFFVEYRLDLMLFLPFEILLESDLRHFDFKRRIVGKVCLLPGDVRLHESVNESTDSRRLIDVLRRVDSLQAEVIRPLYERGLIEKPRDCGGAGDKSPVREIIPGMSLACFFKFVSHCPSLRKAFRELPLFCFRAFRTPLRTAFSHTPNSAPSP